MYFSEPHQSTTAFALCAVEMDTSNKVLERVQWSCAHFPTHADAVQHFVHQQKKDEYPHPHMWHDIDAMIDQKDVPFLGHPVEDVSDIRDLSHMTTYAIDPPGTVEVDDAVSIGNSTETTDVLFVHIADPVRLFPGGYGNYTLQTILWRQRSVYSLSGKGLMYPKEIAKRASLDYNEGGSTTCRAATFQIVLDKAGSVLPESTVFRSKIRSPKTMTYDEAQLAVEQADDPDFETLNKIRSLMLKVKGHRLRGRRPQREPIIVGTSGDISQQFPHDIAAEWDIEADKAAVNSDRARFKIVHVPKKDFDMHDVVSECMISCNRAASFLPTTKKFTFIYRGNDKGRGPVTVGLQSMPHNNLNVTPYTSVTNPLREGISLMNHLFLYMFHFWRNKKLPQSFVPNEYALAKYVSALEDSKKLCKLQQDNEMLQRKVEALQQCLSWTHLYVRVVSDYDMLRFSGMRAYVVGFEPPNMDECDWSVAEVCGLDIRILCAVPSRWKNCDYFYCCLGQIEMKGCVPGAVIVARGSFVPAPDKDEDALSQGSTETGMGKAKSGTAQQNTGERNESRPLPEASDKHEEGSSAALTSGAASTAAGSLVTGSRGHGALAPRSLPPSLPDFAHTRPPREGAQAPGGQPARVYSGRRRSREARDERSFEQVPGRPTQQSQVRQNEEQSRRLEKALGHDAGPGPSSTQVQSAVPVLSAPAVPDESRAQLMAVSRGCRSTDPRGGRRTDGQAESNTNAAQKDLKETESVRDVEQELLKRDDASHMLPHQESLQVEKSVQEAQEHEEEKATSRSAAESICRHSAPEENLPPAKGPQINMVDSEDSRDSKRPRSELSRYNLRNRSRFEEQS